MNKILATIKAIESLDNLTVIAFETHGHELRLMALGLNFELCIGSEVTLSAKSSNISLAKNLQGDLSISNQLPCTIESMEMGELLCSIVLRFAKTKLRSVITKASAVKMQLQTNDTVTALIKASDLSIMQVQTQQGEK
jgi:molybdopterin-binding protein